MPTLQVEKPKLSREDLLDAASRMSDEELDAFCDVLWTLHAGRVAHHINATEAELLEIIHTPLLSEAGLERYKQLANKRDLMSISPDELSEIIELTDEMEEKNLHRVQAIIDLATIRHVKPADIIETLGLGYH